MLVWSISGRALVWSIAALLIGVFYLAPLAVIVVASFSQHWNGVLPSGFTFEHYAAATSGDMRDAVYASVVTGFVASLPALVIIAHSVLVSAFAFGNVSAGLSRLTPDYEEVASCLGARPGYRLLHVTLPLVAPYLLAAFGLSFALSMGELGATVMVYPPGWVTMPVAIFGLTDRGDIFSGAALTMILVAVTLALLIGLERTPFRSAAAR